MFIFGNILYFIFLEMLELVDIIIDKKEIEISSQKILDVRNLYFFVLFGELIILYKLRISNGMYRLIILRSRGESILLVDVIILYSLWCFILNVLKFVGMVDIWEDIFLCKLLNNVLSILYVI